MWYEKKTPLLPVLYYHTSLILAYMQYTNMLKYTVYGTIDLTVVQQNARVKLFNQLPDLCFKLLVIIPKYSQIAESTYTRVIPLMMQFLVLKCVSTYTRGRLIHGYIRYVYSSHTDIKLCA